jgi:hypothetical protein
MELPEEAHSTRIYWGLIESDSPQKAFKKCKDIMDNLCYEIGPQSKLKDLVKSLDSKEKE